MIVHSRFDVIHVSLSFRPVQCYGESLPNVMPTLAAPALDYTSGGLGEPRIPNQK